MGGGVQNLPTIWSSFNYAGAVNINSSSWTAPSAGFICAAQKLVKGYSLSMTVDGVDLSRNLLYVSSEGYESAWFPVNKGSVIKGGRDNVLAIFIPLA